MRIEIAGASPEASLLANLVGKFCDFRSQAEKVDANRAEFRRNNPFVRISPNEILLINISADYKKRAAEVKQEIYELVSKDPAQDFNSQS